MESKKFNQKSIFSVITALLILASIGGILAYLFTRKDATNTIYVGKGDANITEIFEKPPKLTPDDNNIYQKDVKIKNTGENPCFIRVFMDFSDSKVKAKSWISNKESDEKPEANDSSWKHANGTDWIPADWVKLGNYYYYTKPVNAGNSTSSLIRWVKTEFSSDTGNGNIKPQIYDILVYSETVQTIGINGTDYGAGTYGTNETPQKYGYQEAWKEFLRVPTLS